MNRTIFIGTRGSQLALFQANLVKDTLLKADETLKVELVEIRTSGDWTPAMGETKLSARDGGKGLFCKEIEAAMLAGKIDIGVHSMKDMPAFLPDGLQMAHYMKREDPRDVFVSEKYKSINELPEGATIGTSSVRRASFLLNRRPDLKIVPFRGNVPTRLVKVKAGQVDGTFLALAGLNRLGLMKDHFQPLSPEEMLPACGQGVIAIECRKDDEMVKAALDKIECADTAIVASAERALLEELDGSCRTPIGGFAEVVSGTLTLRAQIGAEDGSALWQESGATEQLNREAAAALGRELGARLKAQVPQDLFLEDYELGQSA